MLLPRMLRSIPIGGILLVGLAASLLPPVRSTPDEAINGLANAPTPVDVQEETPIMAGPQHQIRLSAAAPDAPASADDDVSASASAHTGVMQPGPSFNDPVLQHLPPVKERVWGDEAYAISFNTSSLRLSGSGRELAAHPSLPYAVISIRSTAFVYRTEAKWTRVRKLHDHAAASIDAVMFSPNGKWLALTYRQKLWSDRDQIFKQGAYTRLINFDHIITSGTSDDFANLVDGGPLQKARNAMLESLDDALQTGAGWTKTEILETNAASVVIDKLDLAIAMASLRRDAALHRVLEGQLSARSFSPDSQLLFLKTQSNNLSMHDLGSANKPLLRTLSHPLAADADQSPAYALYSRAARFARLMGSQGSFNFVGEITWFGWSPRTSILATISRDGTAIIWNAITGDQLFTFGGVANRLGDGPGGQFSPDGSWFAIASPDSKIYVYSTTTGEALTTIDGTGQARDMAVSSDGKRLAVIAYGGASGARVDEFDTTTWASTRSYTPTQLDELERPCPPGFAPNTKCVDEIEERFFLGHEGELHYANGGALVFRSRLGISVLGDGERELLRIDRKLDDDDLERRSWQPRFMVSPDGEEIWSLDNDDTLRVWELDQTSGK